MKQCVCGVISPDSTTICDCGASLAASRPTRRGRRGSPLKSLHILTILGALAGSFELVNLLASTSASAPQQAAAAAIAVALAVIPYCFARACIEMNGAAVSELQRLNEELGIHTRLLAELANTAAEKSGATGN